MEIIDIKNLSFQYPETNENVLSNISFRVFEGEFVVLCGPSGCGKTTLLQLLKSEIAPIGNVTGDIYYAGKRLEDWDKRTLIEEIGFVFQDPENQIIMDEVMQELVFSLENLRYSQFEMQKRIAEMVHFFGMEDLLKSKPSELSGGQKQMLNLLSVLLLKPKVLLLDEPTSQLDPIAAKDFLMMLDRLNKEMGITIIIVEHRLEELFSLADRMYMMENGSFLYEGNSKELVYKVFNKEDKHFISYLPAIARLYMEKELIPMIENIPLNVKEGKAWLATLPGYQTDKKCDQRIVGEPMITLENVYFQYKKNSPMILRNLSLQIHKGDFYAIVGGNGAGKSTLLKACLGVCQPQRGKVKFLGKALKKVKEKSLLSQVAYLPQNPRTYFIHDTVEKEMLEVIKQRKIDYRAGKIEEMLQLFGISHLRNQHPYDCSGGEMQKAALACMLLSNPDILVMDEPTKGMDPVSKQKFAELLKQLHADGLTIVLVTHDIEFVSKNALTVSMMFDGSIVAEGSPNKLFKGNYFYTTSLNRATQKSHMPEILTIEEARNSWPDLVLS